MHIGPILPQQTITFSLFSMASLTSCSVSRCFRFVFSISFLPFEYIRLVAIRTHIRAGYAGIGASYMTSAPKPCIDRRGIFILTVYKCSHHRESSRKTVSNLMSIRTHSAAGTVLVLIISRNRSTGTFSCFSAGAGGVSYGIFASARASAGSTSYSFWIE